MILFLPIILFFSSIFSVYAENSINAYIEADKTTINLGDSFDITINISIKDTENIAIKEILLEGVDGPFNVIGQSTSQAIEMINGKKEETLKQIINLLAKTQGNFTIGPATINLADGRKIITGSITVDVSNETTIPIPANEDTYTPTDLGDGNTGNELFVDEAKSLLDNNYIVITIIFLLALSLFPLAKYIEISNENKNDTKQKKQEKTLPVLELPDIKDSNFENKIDDYIRKIINYKYDKDTFSMSYSEILEKVSLKEELTKIKELFELLEISKYSKTSLEEDKKKKIIDLVKSLEPNN